MAVEQEPISYPKLRDVLGGDVNVAQQIRNIGNEFYHDAQASTVRIELSYWDKAAGQAVKRNVVFSREDVAALAAVVPAEVANDKRKFVLKGTLAKMLTQLTPMRELIEREAARVRGEIDRDMGALAEMLPKLQAG